MIESPFFTIVTVTRNAHEPLKKTRESLENQSNQSWRHVIVDGQSTDGTVAYGKSISPEKTIFVSETDSGIYNAMNKGWKYAPDFSYIIFLNAGDVFSNQESLDIACKHLKANGYPLWGCTTHEEISPDGELWYSKLVSRPNIRNQLYAYGYRSHQGVVMQKQLFEVLDGFDETYSIAADWDLIARAFMHVEPIEWKSALIKFELGGISSSRILEAHQELYDLRKRYLLKNKIDYFLDYIWRGIYLRNLGYSNSAGRIIEWIFLGQRLLQKIVVVLIHTLFSPLLNLAGFIYRSISGKQKSKNLKRKPFFKIYHYINRSIFLNVNYISARLILKLLKIEDFR